MKKTLAVVSLLMLAILVVPLLAFAQDQPAAPAPEPAAQAIVPWCVLAARPVLGGGRGSAEFHWEAFGGLSDYDEEVDITGMGYLSIIPEAFFMPTSGRRFIISASLPIGGGTGTFEKTDDGRVFDEEKFRYRTIFVNLGLGYQWYFGLEQRTNLFLMTHLGYGGYRFSVEYDDEDYTSDWLRSGYFDISVGSSYRFDNNLVLGGSLDLSGFSFTGEAGEEDFIDVDVDGGASFIRLNFLIGYAFL